MTMAGSIPQLQQHRISPLHEVQMSTERYRKVQRRRGRESDREQHESTKKYREEQRSTENYRELHRSSEKFNKLKVNGVW